MTDRLLYPRPAGSSGPNTTENNGNPASDTAYLNTGTLTPSGVITPPQNGIEVEDGMGTLYSAEPIIQFVNSTVTSDPTNSRNIVTIAASQAGDDFVTNDIDNWVLVTGTPATIIPGTGMQYTTDGVMAYIGNTPFVNGTVNTAWSAPAASGNFIGVIITNAAGPPQAINATYDGANLLINIGGSNIFGVSPHLVANGINLKKNGNEITVTLYNTGVTVYSNSVTLTGTNATNYGAGVAGLGGITANNTTCTNFAETY
jgi:hypothetical protein